MWKNARFHGDALRYLVYLDGQLVTNCFAANEEECWADVYILSCSNEYLIHKIKGKAEVAETRIFGHVELRRRNAITT